MPHAAIRFYADLNAFLPYNRRQRRFMHAFDGRASIKDVVESLGVPHTEVDLLLVNGDAVDFSYNVQDGDEISVYPPFAALDVSHINRVGMEPPEPRFVLDIHLGKLASYLRLLGFDALFPEDYDDANLARISAEQDRITLTRDRGLLKRGNVTYGFCPRSTDPSQQLLEVLRRYELFDQLNPFSRCLRCNGSLKPVAKEQIIERLEPKTKLYYHDFQICEDCRQIYWQGSHFEHLESFIERFSGF